MGSYVELVKSGVDISSLLHQVESSNTSHVSVIKTHSMPPGGDTGAPLEVVETIGKTASVGDEMDIPTIVRSCSIDESTGDLPGQVSRSLDRNYLNQFPVESELRKSLLSRSVDIKVICRECNLCVNYFSFIKSNVNITTYPCSQLICCGYTIILFLFITRFYTVFLHIYYHLIFRRLHLCWLLDLFYYLLIYFK